MRRYSLSLAAAAFLISIASAKAVEINVLAPGVAFNAGLPALADAYTKKTGVQVNVKSDGMSAIVGHIKTGTPIVDVMVLPECGIGRAQGRAASRHLHRRQTCRRA